MGSLLNHGQAWKTVAMDSVNGRRFNQQGRIANGVRIRPADAARNRAHRT